jgi:universal stress protein A
MKFMTEKILVPVDGSENSEKGLRYACRLADKLKARVTILYVVTIPYTSTEQVLDVRPFIKDGQLILERAKKIVEGEKCASAVYELNQGGIGNPGNEIVKFGKEGAFSMIVMSARGHTALTHLLIGSVSDMVVHHSHCPVLIVR